MDFSGLYFLYGIFPLIVLAYFLVPGDVYKNAVLIAASLLLYAMCQPVYVPLILLLCRMNYNYSLKVRKGNRMTLAVPVSINLAIFAMLRYFDPLMVLAGFGTEHGGLLAGVAARFVSYLNGYGAGLAVPSSVSALGLAFFTLNSISYLTDIYRGKHAAEKSFWTFLLHMVLFVKLFQGPLVRYTHTAGQLRTRRENFRTVLDGMVRFCTGLGKKVLLADYCGRMILELAENGSDRALVGSWLAAILFLFRLYYDFSGCCDMAIGLGRIFGFRIPENFNLPYTSITVTDFLARWNLTLTAFFRDYVYTPFTAKRPGTGNRYIALMLCAVLGGIWHGPSLNFLIWGLYLFVFVLAEELFEGYLIDLPDWLRRTMTMLVLLFGWVIFMHSDVQSLAETLKAMIGNGGASVAGDGMRVLNCLPLIIACWIGVTSIPRQIRFRWRNACGMSGRKDQPAQTPKQVYVHMAVSVAYIFLLLWWCTVSRAWLPAVPSVFLSL